MYALIAHGGAGNWAARSEQRLLDGMRAAARAGAQILSGGGAALDAVVAVVAALEDDPLFNAGTGCALNRDGAAEMDAGVMAGRGLRAGSVAAVQRVRNPVLVARRVMEETHHVLLAGAGALAFARAQGFPDYDPVTAARRADWRKRRARAKHDGESAAKGTVGAVALDANGELAAATSTGGVSLKLPGRIGDSAIPGAGNYADAHAAVSATGYGELMLRFVTAKTVCEAIAAGASAQSAVEAVLARMARQLPGDVGIIALDAAGGFGIAHNTPAMPHAVVSSAQPEVRVRMRHTRERS